MALKIGRNDPCPCGSGLKHKKCCGGPMAARPATREQAELFERMRQYHDELKSPRLRAYPYIAVPFRGKKVIGVGTQIMVVPVNWTYADVALGYLLGLLGERWFRSERGRPPEDRHAFSQWHDQLGDELRRIGDEHGIASGPVPLPPKGSTTALAVLADDVFQLGQVMGDKPLAPLIERLKNRRKFQAARYEILSASLFARAGFDVDFTIPSEQPTPEFLATERASGQQVALEAKSIYRAGVLMHESSEPYDKGSIANRKRVLAKLRKARKKAPAGIPFVVFIELNLPAMPAITYLDQIFMTDVQLHLEARQRESPDGACDVSAVVLTNFGWHYHRDAKSPLGQIMTVMPSSPRHPLSAACFDALRRALEEYGWIPDEEMHANEVRARYPEFQ